MAHVVGAKAVAVALAGRHARRRGVKRSEADVFLDAVSARRLAGALLGVAVASGCGSGAVEGADDDADEAREETETDGRDSSGRADGDAGRSSRAGGDAGGSNGDGGGGPGSDGGAGDPDEPDRYSWHLPGGDLSNADPVDIYNALNDGADGCDPAESLLELSRTGMTAGNIRLNEAAIAMCRGDVAGGRRLMAGGAELVFQVDCLLYKAIISVIEQRPQASVTCPALAFDTETPPPPASATDDTTTTTSVDTDETTTTSPDITAEGTDPTDLASEDDGGG